MRMIRVAALWVLMMAMVSVAGLGGSADAAPSKPLPVPYNFPANLANQLADPAGSPPGSNEWSCKPTAAHPDPVVLVHGGFASPQVEWGTLSPVLHNAGYCVFALAWGGDRLAAPFTNFGGYKSVKNVGAPQLSRFVQRVLASTGARRVGMVTHSFGSLASAYYIRYLGGAAKVSAVVSIAGLYTGQQVPEILRNRNPSCAVCTDPVAGSELVMAVNAGGSPYVRGVRYTNISTKYDDTVWPYTAGLLPGKPGQNVTNIVTQAGCAQDYSNHQAIIVTRRTSVFVLNALDPAHRRVVPCQTVLPSYGAVPK